eukprot:COSAG04_NODE_726_length_10783_cov_3.873081_2_plen_221_part_00
MRLRQHMSRAWARYEVLNEAYPITVRGVGGVGLFFIGDVLAQRGQFAQQQRQRQRLADRTPPAQQQPARPSTTAASWGLEQWDGARTLRSCSWRAVVWAPAAHFFWLFLETHISPRVAHLGHRGTALKIVFDFCTIGPPLIFSFLYWSKILECRDPAQTWDHVTERFPSTIVASYIFWAPLHMFTYGLVPLRHRMVWVSMCSVGFGSLLSYFNARELENT